MRTALGGWHDYGRAGDKVCGVSFGLYLPASHGAAAKPTKASDGNGNTGLNKQRLNPSLKLRILTVSRPEERGMPPDDFLEGGTRAAREGCLMHLWGR